MSCSRCGRNGSNTDCYVCFDPRHHTEDFPDEDNDLWEPHETPNEKDETTSHLAD